jgi:RNA polymerase sigma-70 factor (ECF subfamily)
VDQRSVVILRFLNDLSIVETAQALDWTESKVKTTQHRALKVLKKHMEIFHDKEGLESEEVRVER